MSLRLWPASSLSFESDPEESSLGILEVGESAEAGAILTNKSDGDAYEAGCQVYGSSSQGAPIVSFIDSTESLYRSDVGESFLTWEAPTPKARARRRTQATPAVAEGPAVTPVAVDPGPAREPGRAAAADRRAVFAR